MKKYNNIEYIIAKFLMNSISEEEKELLNEWANESENNKKRLEWLKYDNTFTKNYYTYRNINVENAKQKFDSLVNTQGKRKFNFAKLFKYAAILLVPIALTLFLLLNRTTHSEDNLANITPGSSQATLILSNGSKIELNERENEQILLNDSSKVSVEDGGLAYNGSTSSSKEEYNTLIIPRGGEYYVTLSDGSKIHLNAQSTLRYPVKFVGDQRVVYLEGEAFFEIAKDTKRPFIVVANGAKIKQYGTVYNVNAYTKDTKVVLVNGSIGISTPHSDKEYMLNPGQLAEYNKNSYSVSIYNVNIDNYIGWNRGKFAFENEKLSEIAITLSRWYDVDIEFADKSLANQRFTGSVGRHESIKNIMNAISFTDNVKISTIDKKIIISKK